MRRVSVAARASAAGALVALAPPLWVASAAAQNAPAPVAAIQVDGRGNGHGVGMAQDGALAMGKAGAGLKQILGQFYPGTSLGKATGSVRVPVFTGNAVELTFPDGGEVRGTPAANSSGGEQPQKVAPGGSALVYREGDGTRVKTSTAAPPPSPATTAAPTTTSPTTSTTQPPETTTSTTIVPLPDPGGGGQTKAVVVPTTAAPARPAATTAPPPATPDSVYNGAVIAVPTGNGRIGVTPRGHRYRGVVEMTPSAGNAVRFVNQVPVETYLRGMGEVRNPSWPAASLQAQAVAARTYALRAMTVAGELCDTQRCQVYLGADAEYAAMDKAVAATSGQVLVFGKSLASAVYSANGGGNSASREEGFGLTGAGYPYLRAAPYPCTDPAPWSTTIALRDVAARLNYRGDITAVQVTGRGPSGRATQVTLRGASGDVTVTGIQFDGALGLRSTLFELRVTTATNVPALTGGSELQAPPEEAAVPEAEGAPLPRAASKRSTATVSSGTSGAIGGPAAVASALWLAVVAATFVTRRRERRAWQASLS